MNVTKSGQAAAEVGQNQDRISTATQRMFLSTRANLAAVLSIGGHFC